MLNVASNIIRRKILMGLLYECKNQRQYYDYALLYENIEIKEYKKNIERITKKENIIFIALIDLANDFNLKKY